MRSVVSLHIWEKTLCTIDPFKLTYLISAPERQHCYVRATSTRWKIENAKEIKFPLAGGAVLVGFQHGAARR